MDYPIDYEDERDESAPRWAKARIVLLSLLMVMVLAGSAIVEGWSLLPWMLGYWNNDYSLHLHSISAGNCLQNHSQPDGIPPTTSLCICGNLDARGGSADVNIRLLDSTGTRLDQLRLRDMKTGTFCRPLLLQTRLLPGSYLLGVQPRLWRNDLFRVRFQVVDEGRSI